MRSLSGNRRDKLPVLEKTCRQQAASQCNALAKRRALKRNSAVRKDGSPIWLDRLFQGHEPGAPRFVALIPQQPGAGDDGKGILLRIKVRAPHWGQPDVQQVSGLGARPGRAGNAVTNSQSDASGVKISKSSAHFDVYENFGMLATETVQSRNKEEGGECRLHADSNFLRIRRGQDCHDGSIEPVEALRCLREQPSPDGIEAHCAVMAMEKWLPQQAFEVPDLSANCRLGDGKFVCCTLEALMSSGGLEGSKSGKRQSAAAHEQPEVF